MRLHVVEDNVTAVERCRDDSATDSFVPLDHDTRQDEGH